MVKDPGAEIEVSNVKISGLEVAIEHIRDGSIYIGGMAATIKIIKSSYLPFGAKLGAVLDMETASLLGFKMVQNNLSPNSTSGNLNIKADKISSIINSTSSKDSKNNNPYINKLLSDYDSNNNNDSYISSLNIEQLQLDLYLHLVIIYLIKIVIIFLIMKSLTEREIKFYFIIKYYKGEYLQALLIKIFKWWKNANIVSVYLILINVLICINISAWSIYIILNHLN